MRSKQFKEVPEGYELLQLENNTIQAGLVHLATYGPWCLYFEDEETYYEVLNPFGFVFQRTPCLAMVSAMTGIVFLSMIERQNMEVLKVL